MSAEPIDINRAGQRPAHHIPTASGHWRFSTGGPTWDRGVYRQDENATTGWAYVAPLPYVTERLTRRDGDGRRRGVELRLTMDPASSDSVIMDADDVRMGRWPSRLDVAVPTDRKLMDAVSTAIDAVARFRTVPVREGSPRWIRDELHYPPADVGPTGYLRHARDEDRARAAWQELATIAGRSPKLALVAGASLGGLFLAPLKRQGHIIQMVGEARQGKTTGLTLAGAVLGDPGECHETTDGFDTGGGTVESWSATAVGVLQHLGDLGVYPALFDEIGAAGLGPARKEQLVFQLTEGAQRRTGGRTGRSTRSAPWRSVMISTGNESITSGVVNEGVHARVVEIPTPITASPADAERVPELVAVGYGWPTAWLLRAGTDLDGMRAAVLRAQERIGMPDGGVPRTLAKHLALAVAGAERLARLVGTDEDLAGAATAAAADILAAMVAEIAERGLNPGVRLMSAVRQALATRPFAFPTVEDYRAAVKGTDPAAPKLPPVVDGVHLDAARLAVFSQRLKDIAGEAGIEDATTGLRILRDRGRLDAGGDKDGRLKRDIRVGGPKVGAYVFRLEDEPDEATHEGHSHTDGPGPGGQDTPDTSGTSPHTPTDPAPDTTPDQPESAVTTTAAPTWENATMDEALAHEAAATHEANRAPARVATPTTTRPAPRTRHEDTTPGGADEVLALALDADAVHTYTPHGITTTEPGTLATHLGRFLDHVARVMPNGGTVAIDSDAADTLGWPELPEHRDERGAPLVDRPRAVQDAQHHGWTCSTVHGWTTWTKGTDKSPDFVAVTVATLPWMDAAALGTSGHMMLTVHEHEREDGQTGFVADDAATAVYLLGRVRELSGTPWAYTGGSTWCMGVRDRYFHRSGQRRQLAKNVRVPMLKLNNDPARGPVAPAFHTPDAGLRWANPAALAGGNHTGRYVIGYDAIGAHLGTAARTSQAVNRLVELDTVEWDPGVAGLWQMEPGTFTVGDGAGPPVAGPAASSAAPWWAHTEQVKLLVERGLISDAFTTRAWVPVDHNGKPVRGGTQVFRKQGERIRDAIASIPRDTPDELEKRVRKALKSMYAEAAGEMTRHPFLLRPDWAMGIWSGSRAQIVRTILKVYDETGMWPIEVATDCLYYETSGPDPDKDNPAPAALKYDETETKLGHFKADFIGTMAEFAEKRNMRAPGKGGK